MSQHAQEHSLGFWRGTARLSLLLFFIAVLISRVALVAHEFAGHAAPAVALGGELEGYRLYMFAGGFVSFSRHQPFEPWEQLLISLGGIGVELIIALFAAWCAHHWRRNGLSRLLALGFATVLFTHAGYYLASSSFHGFGDGRLLHHKLGPARVWFALAIALVTVAACGYLAGRFNRGLRGFMSARTRQRRLASLLIAVLFAGALHGALAIAELTASNSARYGVVMQHQSDRDAARELANKIAAERARGRRMSSSQVAEAREEIETRHRQFPFGIVLAIALVGAAAVGAWRSESAPRDKSDTSHAPPSWATLGLVALLTTLSLVLVALLRGGS